MNAPSEYHKLHIEEDERLGISGELQFNSQVYDELEVAEINDMLLRVLVAWLKRRTFVLQNPKAFGYKEC